MSETPNIERRVELRTVAIWSAVALWTLFSVGYIVKDRWEIFKAGQLREAVAEAVNHARRETVQQVMNEARKCQPFPVRIEDQSVELIGTACQQQQQQFVPPQQAAQGAPSGFRLGQPPGGFQPPAMPQGAP